MDIRGLTRRDKIKLLLMGFLQPLLFLKGAVCEPPSLIPAKFLPIGKDLNPQRLAAHQSFMGLMAGMAGVNWTQKTRLTDGF